MVTADGYQVAPRVSACELDGAGCGIRSVLAEFHHFRPRDQVEKLLGTC